MRSTVFLIWIGATMGSSAMAQEESGQPTPPVLPSPPASPAVPSEIHDFDFWVGDWEVTAQGKVVGWNRVEAILGGRVVQENYTTPGKFAGHSYSLYNAPEQRWEQYWVDVTGLALHLKGSLDDDGSMVLQGERRTNDGSTVIDRVTWTPNADGSVRQHWENSTDGGATWNTVFDGRYVLKATPATP